MANLQATTARHENRLPFSPSLHAPAPHEVPPSLRPRHRLGILPALVLAVLAFFAVSALESFSVSPDRPAAILFPESVSEEQAFAAIVAAGGLPVRPARSALSDGVVWIAAAGSPDFFDRVKARGAWAVINPFAFGGCFLVKPV